MPDLVPRSLATQMNALKQCARPWSPWPYQEVGLKYVLNDPQSGLLLDPGMGKTSITLAMMKILLKKRMARRALVVAPLRPVYRVWPQEVSEWQDFNELGVAMLHGGNKEDILRALRPEHQIVLINPEGLDWLFDRDTTFRQLQADCLVVDESSKFKNSNTVRFRRLKSKLKRFQRRHILTGSPRPRNYLDLFSQIYVLDCGATLGCYVTSYRQKFFYPTGYQSREWYPLPDASEQINKLVAPLVLRLEGEKYLNLPKVPPDRIHKVDMPEKARALYDTLEREMIVDLFGAGGRRTLIANSTGAVRSKCAQIANGCVYTTAPDEEWHGPRRPFQAVHTAKVEALVDLYEELQGEPLLVAIGYHHDVDAIRKALGEDILVVNSTTTQRQEDAIFADWNAGRLSILLGHPASMGHGLNLQKCNCRHVAFFDITDNYDDYDQFYKRVRRQGNKAQFVFRHHFVSVNTVDDAKMRNLRAKGNGQNAFLSAMRLYAEKRGLLAGLK